MSSHYSHIGAAALTSGVSTISVYRGIGPEFKLFQPAGSPDHAEGNSEPYEIDANGAFVVNIGVTAGFRLTYCAIINDAGTHFPGVITNGDGTGAPMGYAVVTWAGGVPKGCDLVLRAEGIEIATGDAYSGEWRLHSTEEEGECDLVDDSDPIGGGAGGGARGVFFARSGDFDLPPPRVRIPSLEVVANPVPINRNLMLRIRTYGKLKPFTAIAIRVTAGALDFTSVKTAIVYSRSRRHLCDFVQLDAATSYVVRILFRGRRSYQSPLAKPFRTP